MEEDGLVVRTVYPKFSPRVEYALSEPSQSMEPIIVAMEDLGKSLQK